jgi:hypothetical protein
MRRELRKFLVGFAVVAGAALSFSSACSSSSSPSADQACADVATARCQKMQECNPQGLLNTYGDLSSCESRQSANCVMNLAAPQTANTPAHTESCAQATPSQSCSDFALGNVPSACTPPAGPRDAGSPCSVSAQCATAYCLISRTSACGVCAPQPRVGDSCANNGCGPGLLCDSMTSQCVAPVGTGGSCTGSSVCAPGYTCIGNTDTTTGTCVALATTVGASCDVADGGTRCDGRQGLYCNVPQGRVCAKVADATATLECGTVDGGVIDCTAGAFCQKAAGSKSGICIAPAVDGAACDRVNGPTCASPSRCVLSVEGGTTGTCQTTNPSACN